MLQKIKNHLTIILSLFALTVPTLAPMVVSAATISENVCTGVQSASSSTQGCTGNQNITSGIKNIAVTVVNILSIVVGIVAVVMIIFGGFRYITSGGESNNVSSAKNTLLFAIVGLVIVVLAQVIVRWVIGTSTNISNGTPTGFLF